MTVIMLAPKGGRRGRADHSAIPLTPAETVEAAGADVVHVHLRDADGRHWLDAGAYAEIIAAIGDVAPRLAVQVTTESVDRDGAGEQMRLLRDLRPRFASCALRELARDGESEAGRFYAEMAEAGVSLQHILYDPAEVAALKRVLEAAGIARPPAVIFVVGLYPDGGGVTPLRLATFLEALPSGWRPGPQPGGVQWMACGFGRAESRVLAAVMALGGHARVGFENGLHIADGRLAPDNTARVLEIAALRHALGLRPDDAGLALGDRSAMESGTVSA